MLPRSAEDMKDARQTKLQDNSGQREIISENLVKGHSNPAYKQVDKEANVPLSHKITLTKKIHSIAPQQSTFWV